MKSKSFFLLQAGALVLAAWAASAGTVEFMRDQLGVDPAKYPFGSPASAFPGIPRAHATANGEQLDGYLTGADTNAPPRIFQLNFVSNRLEAITVHSYHDKRNDALVAGFAKLLNRDAKQITGSQPFEVREGERLFSFRRVCSAEQNFAVIFHLTTVDGAERMIRAGRARLAGPPFFALRSAVPTVSNDALQSAWVMIERNSGPTTNVSVKAPPGVSVQLNGKSSAAETDYYNLFFRPDGTNFLPESWQFSVVCTDQQQKQHEKKFDVLYNWKAKAPLNLQVIEAKN